MKAKALFLGCALLMGLLMVNGIVVAGGVTGHFQLDGYGRGDGAGVVLLQGAAQGVDAILIYLVDTGELLMSVGPEAPEGLKGKHVFCNLDRIDLEIELVKYEQSGLRLEGRHAKEKSEFLIGQWGWKVEGDFGLFVDLTGKSTGCFSTATCGSTIINGPYCDPCLYQVCCYGESGFIQCGTQLCP